MAIRAKFLGREALAKRLAKLVPEAEKEVARAQLEAAEELAEAIENRAPLDTGEYRASIKGGRLADNPTGRLGDNPPAKAVGSVAIGGLRETKDKNATGIFALYIWRFLEFGTKASAGEAPSIDRRYKNSVFNKGQLVMTKGKRAHAATPAQPHIFPTYRARRKAIRRKVAAALNRAVRARGKGK